MSNIVLKFAVYEMETGNFTVYVPFPKWKFFSGKMETLVLIEYNGVLKISTFIRSQLIVLKFCLRDRELVLHEIEELTETSLRKNFYSIFSETLKPKYKNISSQYVRSLKNTLH